jgi:signal transduction histidine kinase
MPRSDVARIGSANTSVSLPLTPICSWFSVHSTADAAARNLALCWNAVVYPAVRLDSVSAVRELGDKRMPLALIQSSRVKLLADPVLLRRALENILRNAIWHTALGSTVEVALETRGADAAVTVRDYGPGVPAEQRTCFHTRRG